MKIYIETSDEFIMKPPLEVFLSITTKCNLKCKHCYSNSGLFGKTSDTDNLIKILAQIRPLRLVISGGEPILEIERLISFLKKYKLKKGIDSYVVLATNGILLNNRNLNRIKPYVDRLQISLDTLNPDTFKKIRGLKLLKQTINGIKLAKKRGFDLQIAFSIFKENLDEYKKIIDFCINNKINRINILRQRPSGRSKCSVSAKEIKRVYSGAVNYALGKDINVNIHDPIANIIIPKRSECNAAKEIIAIDVDGNFKPCPLFNSSVKGNFKDVWKNSKLFRLVRRQVGGCISCEKYKLCRGGCKADSFNLYGKIKKDPWCLRGV